MASNKESEQPTLPLIAQESETTREAKKYVRFKDNGSVELTSASHKGVFRIKNCKVPISTSALRFEEL